MTRVWLLEEIRAASELVQIANVASRLVVNAEQMLAKTIAHARLIVAFHIVAESNN